MWDSLKNSISNVIKTDGNQEITGQVLQSTLNSIVDTVGENATFAGIATPSTNPGSPDGPVFYIAVQAGAYPNFGGITVIEGRLNILKYTHVKTWERSEILISNYIEDKSVEDFVNEVNVSKIYPTGGTSGTNKYTLETAITKIPTSLRHAGIKCSFLNEDNQFEIWEWDGTGAYSNLMSWQILPSQYYVDSSVVEPLTFDNIAVSGGHIINNNGEAVSYGMGACTDFIELNSAIVLKNVLSTSSNQAIVAFYDTDKTFISDYKDYVASFTSGQKEFKLIVIYPSVYPNAKYCRISYGLRRDGVTTEIKKVSLKSRIGALESNVSQTQELIKVKTNLASTAYKSVKYITTSGVISSWGTNKLYKIELPLSYSVIVIDKLVAVANPCLLAAYYRGEDEFISTIFQAKSKEVKNNLTIKATDIPSEAEYILLSSDGDNIPNVYSLDANANADDLKELISLQDTKSNNIIGVLEDEFVPKKSPGYINYLGSVASWGTANVTDFIELKQKYIRINDIRTIAGRIYVVAFYDTNKEFIADYNDFFYNSSSGERNIEEISFFGSDYPLASYIRISGIFQAGTEIRTVDVYGINKRLLSLETAFSNSDFSKGNPIYGIGDSIGSQILTALVTNIETIDERQIINGCIGGETVLDSLGKNNVIPYVALPFTIPAGTTQSGAITVYSSRYLKTSIAEDGTTLSYSNVYRVGETGLESNPFGEGISPWNTLKCTIGGVKGTLYFTRSTPNRPNNYFIRDEAGEEVIFDRPQLVIPTELKNKNSIWIAFLGTNGGWVPADTRNDFNKSADILVNYYKQLRDYIGHDNYVFLGFYSTAYIDQTIGPTRVERWKYFEDRMVEEFGKHYLSVRQYLREYGWRDAGYQLGYRLVEEEGNNHYTCTKEDIASDKQAIADGRIPYCIVNGESGVHMLSKPSACVANQVIKRLYELGCINECPQIDVETIEDAENADINEPDYGG